MNLSRYKCYFGWPQSLHGQVSSWDLQLCSLPGGSFRTWVPLSQRSRMLGYFECRVNKREITPALPPESCCCGLVWMEERCSPHSDFKEFKDSEFSAPGILGKRRCTVWLILNPFPNLFLNMLVFSWISGQP